MRRDGQLKMAEASITPHSGHAPSFTGKRLFVLATGALTVSFLPTWMTWLHSNYSHLELTIGVTRSASKLVSCDALRALTHGSVFVDSWDVIGASEPKHLELAEWPDSAIVFPASVHFIARFASGLADTPSLLGLLLTKAPIGIAPALPPGADRNPIIGNHLRTLAQMPNVVIPPLKPARSARSGKMEATGAGSLHTLLELVEDLRPKLGGVAANMPDSDGTAQRPDARSGKEGESRGSTPPV
jgi:hypothetical protein